ncbi:MAG: hypothetical protein PHF25_05740 [Candidatus Margulisbacteria bacterium]|nr:hypothetical protein [Candidatus Margulisiibacteriota bacterium]
MKKNRAFTAIVFVCLLGIQVMAYTPAVIGGVRDGTALGLVFESGSRVNDLNIRFGLEATTSNTPGIMFVGGKWFLRDLNNTKLPMFLNLGIVAYLGNEANVGPYVSIMLERFLDMPDLFLEVGIDIVTSGKLQAQVGYFF